jgi:uncharacterized protein
MAIRFEWDVAKAAANEAKHGVSFGEATTAFSDPLGRVVPDPRHSVGEERLALLALSARGRLLAVMFTEREQGEVIRIISARLATRHERRDYEEGEG